MASQKAVAVALPSTDDELITESANPYLQLTFSEAAENTADITFEAVDKDDDYRRRMSTSPVMIADITATFKSVKDGTDTVALDAHKKVTLTAVTLDGEGRIGLRWGRGMSTTGDRFTIALRGLSAAVSTR